MSDLGIRGENQPEETADEWIERIERTFELLDKQKRQRQDNLRAWAEETG